MLRWIMRKVAFCMVIIGLFYYLNLKEPQWMQTFGRWIGGEVGNRVSVVVDNMLEGMEENKILENVMEVFREEN